ncbi:hypothetical protein OAN22_00130 [Alphaproteobacteria bacterium]|nr:hypothetical protein [Alphaproteobacteria bacterium]
MMKKILLSCVVLVSLSGESKGSIFDCATTIGGGCQNAEGAFSKCLKNKYGDVYRKLIKLFVEGKENIDFSTTLREDGSTSNQSDQPFVKVGISWEEKSSTKQAVSDKKCIGKLHDFGAYIHDVDKYDLNLSDDEKVRRGYGRQDKAEKRRAEKYKGLFTEQQKEARKKAYKEANREMKPSGLATIQ